jgi:hypothetical protein
LVQSRGREENGAQHLSIIMGSCQLSNNFNVVILETNSTGVYNYFFQSSQFSERSYASVIVFGTHPSGKGRKPKEGDPVKI